MSDRKIAKPKSLTALALERIRQGIVTGDYPLGSPLYEKVLAEEFGISKTPVREALVQLQHDGLVVVVPHSGTYVFSLGDSELRELCELRLILETNALQLAMQREPAQLVAQLRRIIDGMSDAIKAGEIDRYYDLDSAFHSAFFTHSGNSYLQRCHESIEIKVSTLRTALIAPFPDVVPTSIEEHRQFVAVLAASETDQAIAILTAHIRRSRDLMQRLNDVDPVDVTRV